MTSTSPIKRFFYFFPTIVLYIWGLLTFRITGKTSKLAYKSLRFLHVITNGKINSITNKYISIFRKQKKELGPFDSILGSYGDAEIDNILETLRKDGCYVFDQKLSDKIIKDILEFGSSIPALPMTENGKYGSSGSVVNQQTKADSPRYQFRNVDLFQNENLVKIICDKLFLNIAERYLKCRPIFDYFVMWWSFPFKGKLQSQAAQKYHFDMDRIKFIKFFFYVTDVETNTGPHCFVKGSHNSKPSALRKDGRIEDSEIEKYSKKEDIVEICGQKGTVMIVDTIGFHKGKTLTEGSRLLFQILYSNSLFGADTEKIDLPKEAYENHKSFLDDNRDVFSKTLNY